MTQHRGKNVIAKPVQLAAKVAATEVYVKSMKWDHVKNFQRRWYVLKKLKFFVQNFSCSENELSFCNSSPCTKEDGMICYNKGIENFPETFCQMEPYKTDCCHKCKDFW